MNVGDMAVISILNSKGGVGKTTLAVNLAGGIAARGLDVLLVDSDPQGSSIDWGWVRESSDMTKPDIAGLNTLRAINTVGKKKEKFDHVVIDGSARLEELSVAAIKVSDMVVIPIKASPVDLWAARPVVRLVQKRQEQLQKAYGGIKQLRCALCVAQQIRGSLLAKQIGAAAQELGQPVLVTRMNHRVAYAHSFQVGMTVQEFEPGGKAAKEVEDLTKEILEFIDSP